MNCLEKSEALRKILILIKINFELYFAVEMFPSRKTIPKIVEKCVSGTILVQNFWLFTPQPDC